MITLNIDYSEYSLLIQSLLTERQSLKNALKGESKKSPVYDLFSGDIKRIDLFLLKLKEGHE